MKKLKILALNLLLLSQTNGIPLVSTCKKVYADEGIKMINKEGILITQSNYEKLLRMGFTDREIQYMDNSEYEHFASFEIKYTNTHKEMVKKEVKINNKNESLRKMTFNKKINSSSLSVNNVEEEYTTQFSYRMFTLHTSYIEELEGKPTFFVKVTIDWLNYPFDTYTDLISICHSDTLTIRKQTLSGAQYVWFRASMIYDKLIASFSDDYAENEPETIVERFYGSNYTDYSYTENSGISVGLNLPMNTIGTTYSNLQTSLFAYFTPEIIIPNSTVVASFSAAYAHNTLQYILYENIDVSLSIGEPFLSASVSLDTEENPYEDIFGGFIQIDGVIPPGSGSVVC